MDRPGSIAIIGPNLLKLSTNSPVISILSATVAKKLRSRLTTRRVRVTPASVASSVAPGRRGPIRTAQAKCDKNKKWLTGEQVRWGFENLDLTVDRIKELGFKGVFQPVKVSCADHEGARNGRIQT
jgi:hypothetical protein